MLLPSSASKKYSCRVTPKTAKQFPEPFLLCSMHIISSKRRERLHTHTPPPPHLHPHPHPHTYIHTHTHIHTPTPTFTPAPTPTPSHTPDACSCPLASGRCRRSAAPPASAQPLPSDSANQNRFASSFAMQALCPRECRSFQNPPASARSLSPAILQTNTGMYRALLCINCA